MRLRGIRGSRNVVDRRGVRGGKAGGIGIVGVLVVLAIGYFTGIDVSPLLNGGSGATVQQGEPRELTAEERQAGEFVARVLTTTEDVWGGIFPRAFGREYRPPQLVLFSGAVQSGCGGATAQAGPFYCPADRRAYMDTEFFATMQQQLGAGGDFAAAYVVAHEIAHHVQNELGILPQVNQRRQASSQADANALTVRLELQADCLSGVWARNVEGLMERGDLQEALNAARQIGDDTLQRRAGRVPQPHTFTHGTSEQRQRWFRTGFDTGDPNKCDTFGARRL